MFEKIRIKEHMEVADCKGQHVGTVDEVEGDAIKLTKSDSADSMHHFRALDDVEKIDEAPVPTPPPAPAACLAHRNKIPRGPRTTR